MSFLCIMITGDSEIFTSRQEYETFTQEDLQVNFHYHLSLITENLISSFSRIIFIVGSQRLPFCLILCTGPFEILSSSLITPFETCRSIPVARTTTRSGITGEAIFTRGEREQFVIWYLHPWAPLSILHSEKLYTKVVKNASLTHTVAQE